MPTFSDVVTDYLSAHQAALGESPDGWRRQRSDSAPGPIFYSAGFIGGPIGQDGPPQDTLVAVPFLSARGLDIDQLLFRVAIAGALGAVARVGIYEADERSLIPTNLVIDGGEQSGVAPVGVRSTNVSLRFNAARLYYFVYLANTGEPVVATIPPAMPFFGVDDALTSLRGAIEAPFIYGPLPPMFPNGITFSGFVPLIAVRAS